MGCTENNVGSESLADEMDTALAAFHGGDSVPLERLVGDVPGNGPGLETLMAGAAAMAARSGVPARIGDYTIIREIGRGGMGVVYEAEQRSPKRRVALKVLRNPWADELHIKLFMREIQALACFQHPAIATIYEAGCTPEGEHYFTMELVNGRPLHEHIAAAQPPLAERLDFFAKVCDGVQYAHDKGVIHRDLKPANIFVDAAGQPRILDFGLARAKLTDTGLSVTIADSGHLVGTVAYAGPEQARGDWEHVGPRSDVYSLGVILYELMTGQLPYRVRGVSLHQAASVVCEEPPRRPRTLLPRLSPVLEAIVLNALEKEPARRCPSAQQLGDDLRRYLAGEPTVIRPASWFSRAWGELVRHRARVALLAFAATVAAGGVGAGVWWMDRGAARQQLRASAAAKAQSAIDLANAESAALDAIEKLERGQVSDAYGAAKSTYDRCGLLPGVIIAYARASLRVNQTEQNDGGYRGALRELRWLADHSPHIPGLALVLLEAHGPTGPEEVGHWQAMVAGSTPKSAEDFYLWSIATSDPQKARDWARQATDLDPHLGRAWRRLWFVRQESRDFEGALAALRSLMRIEGESNPWVVAEANLLARTGRCDEAVRSFERAAASSRGEDIDVCYRGRGAVLLCMGRCDESIDAFSIAARLDTSSAGAWARYARATPLWIRGRFAQAADDYRAVHLIREGGRLYEDARLYLLLHEYAAWLRSSGREDEAAAAEGEARSLLADALQRTIAGSRMREIFRCLNHQVSPERLVQSADPLRPDEVCEYAYYAGEVCLLDGRPADACRFYEQCVATDIVFDPQGCMPDPMNEYHLAVWRLASLLSEPPRLPCPPDHAASPAPAARRWGEVP